MLSNEVKRKQYDLGFKPNHGSTGEQKYYRPGSSNIDPQELFKHVFGEFGNFNYSSTFFDERPEV